MFAGDRTILFVSFVVGILGIACLADVHISHRSTPSSEPFEEVISVDLGGLPVSGDRATAERAGLTECREDGSWGPRCRNTDVEVAGISGLVAEVDLDWPEERFNRITLTAADQRELTAMKHALIAKGFRPCRSKGALHLTKTGAPIMVSIPDSILPARTAIATARGDAEPVCDRAQNPSL